MISREDFFFSFTVKHITCIFKIIAEFFWLPQKSHLQSKERHLPTHVRKPQYKAQDALFQASFKLMLHLESIG